MKRYILSRILRSLVSIFLVVSVVFVMVYGLVPRENVFKGDTTINKLLSKPDTLAQYKNNTLERLGYIEYVEQQDICAANYADSYSSCMAPKSTQIQEWASENAGSYTIGYNTNSDNLIYATREIPMLQRIGSFYSKLIQIDTSSAVSDAQNPNIERKVYFGSDTNGVPALMCTGCTHKYLVYFDTSFPFIHQNFIELNLGTSYPSYSGQEAFSVITQGQGSYENSPTTFYDGTTKNSSALLHSCKYKSSGSITDAETQLYGDNYALCDSRYQDPSMIQTSSVIGIIALVLAYGIGIPLGMTLARRKGSYFDRIGIGFITVLIALPSLALIYFMSVVGASLFGLPDKFPFFGAHNPISYVLPVLVLFLLNLPGILTWVRRYTIDQSSADYVKFAYAKGLSKKEVFNRHILKNAMIPVVQGIPSSIISVLSGALITETVFSVPGMGKMLPDAITGYNNPMVIALTLIFTTISVVGLLLGDLLVSKFDPRIRLTTRKGG